MEILKLKPVFKNYLWGGHRLETDFGFQSGLEKTAEAWMLACHPDGINIIESGSYDGMALNQIPKEWQGNRAAALPAFPILIKLIDAKENLSVQVHPDDDYARRVENEYGKTEMWYVLDAAKDATLIYGFKHAVSRETFRRAIEENTLLQQLNCVPVQKGDVFFIEAGTVHAIGKGALIAEIQQNSNCTYRVYDYGRKDKNGQMRPLHIEKALDVSVIAPPAHNTKPMGEEEHGINYTKQLLTACDFFKVYRYAVTGETALIAHADSFHHLLILDGSGTIDGKTAEKGDSFFVPAGYGRYCINGTLGYLLTTI